MRANLEDDRREAKAVCTNSITAAVLMTRMVNGNSIDPEILFEEIEVALYDAAIASTLAVNEEVEMNDATIDTCRRLSKQFREEARKAFGL